MRLILICFLLGVLLITCKKSTPTVPEVDDQPMTISLEINGEQSHEVRVK
mgnify:CR=1 FL=1